MGQILVFLSVFEIFGTAPPPPVQSGHVLSIPPY
jgi:hypothetical protein